MLARDLALGSRDIASGRSRAAARSSAVPQLETWPRTRREPNGPGSACGCRGGWLARRRFGWRSGARSRTRRWLRVPQSCRCRQSVGDGPNERRSSSRRSRQASGPELVLRVSAAAGAGSSPGGRGRTRSARALALQRSIGSPVQLQSSISARSSDTSTRAKPPRSPPSAQFLDRDRRRAPLRLGRPIASSAAPAVAVADAGFAFAHASILSTPGSRFRRRSRAPEPSCCRSSS